MSESNAQVTGVVGAGLMGHGIAYLFARAGHDVRIHDPDAAVLGGLRKRLLGIANQLGDNPAVIDRVVACPDLAEAVRASGFVFEAAPERLELKQAIFADLDRLAPGDAILASNTSVIPIGRIAAHVSRRARVVGAHFWNPPHLVPLVEVIEPWIEARPAVMTMIELLRSVGRKPVHVRKDIPGFIGNRLQHALKREAIALVAAGVCDAETLDEVVKTGFGARLAVLGPLEQSDMVGLDLTRNIHDVLIQDLDRTPGTHPYLQNLVDRGDLGMKTGRGFRSWTKAQADEVRSRLQRYLADAVREAVSSTNRKDR